MCDRSGGVLAGFAVLVVVGLLPLNLFRTRERSRAWAITTHVLTVFYVLFPILMMYGLSLLKPAYRPKFFLVAVRRSVSFWRGASLVRGARRASPHAGRRSRGP